MLKYRCPLCCFDLPSFSCPVVSVTVNMHLPHEICERKQPSIPLSSGSGTQVSVDKLYVMW
jgi:hypothetical protein